MESTSRHGRALQSHVSLSLKQRRSGYEPSDTETELHDSPWREPDQKTEDLDQFPGLNALQDQDTSKAPVKLSRRTTGKLEIEATPQRATTISPTRRRHSKSPYAPRRDDIKSNFESRGNVNPFSRSEHCKNDPDDVKPDSESPITASLFSRSERPRYSRDDVMPDSDGRRSVNAFSKSEHRRHISPYKNSTTKVSEVSNYNRRTASAPRARLKKYESFKQEDDKEKKRTDRNQSPLPRNAFRKEREGTYKHNSSGGEINEMLANVKISKAPPGFVPTSQSTESIAPGDIFFSRDDDAFPMQNNIFSKNGSTESKFGQKPESYTERDPAPHQGKNGNNQFKQHTQVTSARTVSTRSSINASSAFSRQTSNLSDHSGRTNGSTRKFVANRQKNQNETWFSCIKKGSCRRSRRSPGTLSGFTCHKQEALLLKQLIMEVLIQIARKEDFELPMSFAAKIANKSKQNMRRAIMALEAIVHR